MSEPAASGCCLVGSATPLERIRFRVGGRPCARSWTSCRLEAAQPAHAGCAERSNSGLPGSPANAVARHCSDPGIGRVRDGSEAAWNVVSALIAMDCIATVDGSCTRPALRLRQRAQRRPGSGHSRFRRTIPVALRRARRLLERVTRCARHGWPVARLACGRLASTSGGAFDAAF
jgi:hypothetical protein